MLILNRLIIKSKCSNKQKLIKINRLKSPKSKFSIHSMKEKKLCNKIKISNNSLKNNRTIVDNL